MNTPPIPERNIYPFSSMAVGGYDRLNFATREAAIKARTAAHSLGTRLKRKFVTELSYNGGRVYLDVWRNE